MTPHETYDPDLHDSDEPYDRCPLCNAAIAAIFALVIGAGLYSIGTVLAALFT